MSDDRKPVYLDHNASTPVLPEVLDAMLPYLRERFGNPSSSHYYGTVLREAMERARSQVAALIECEPQELYFTSGGTESNNLAIRGACAARRDRRELVTSLIEHPASTAPCALLEQQGYRVFRSPVDDSGRVRVDKVAAAISNATALVTIIHANSETGSLQPIREIAGLAHGSGALMHCDAAQTVGKVRVSVTHDELDLMSIAGHKLYAPKGIGALYIRDGVTIEPLSRGANHERGLRPGTENVAFIVGLGAACAIARTDLDETARRMGDLRDRLWSMLVTAVPGIALNGGDAQRLPNTLNVRFPRVSGNAVLAACPEIAASTGSACHEGEDSPSAVITAMGVPPHEALGSVRLSLGRGTSAADIELAANALARAWQQLDSR
jgi:cysteine desulfurase